MEVDCHSIIKTLQRGVDGQRRIMIQHFLITNFITLVEQGTTQHLQVYYFIKESDPDHLGQDGFRLFSQCSYMS